MSLDIRERPSPNHGSRGEPPDVHPINMLVLHYTGMQSGAAALDRLCDLEARVSSHYLVEEDGTIWRLVPESRRAFHAGVSCWQGEKDLNYASIGVEIVNPGHEFGYRPFPEAQVAAVIAFVADIRSRWTIEDRNLVGHSDVAPERKEDPGELFPWKRLAEAGHGLWAEWPPAPGEPLAERNAANFLTINRVWTYETKAQHLQVVQALSDLMGLAAQRMANVQPADKDQLAQLIQYISRVFQVVGGMDRQSRMGRRRSIFCAQRLPDLRASFFGIQKDWRHPVQAVRISPCYEDLASPICPHMRCPSLEAISRFQFKICHSLSA